MEDDTGQRNRRRATVGLALAALALIPLYTGNHGLGTAPEVQSAALATHSLVRQGDLAVTEHIRPGAPLYYAFVRRGSEVYSMEPPAPVLTFAPFAWGWRDAPPGRLPLARMGDRTASRVAAFAAFVLGAWLLRVTTLPRALAATAALALGTSWWTIGGGALWTHSAALLWLPVGLFAWWTAATRPGWYPAAGAALALATLCRPPLLPAALLVVAEAIRRPETRRQGVATGAVVAAIGLAGLYANWSVHGSLLGGRAEIVAGIDDTHAVSGYVRFSLENLAGLLLAPSRGLLVFSPVLLFALPGLVATLRRGARRPLAWITAAGLASFGLYGFVATWWGGVVYGPRYMTDLLPFFGLWLACTPLPRRRRAAWAAAFGLAFAASVGVQALGHARYPCGWNTHPVSVDQDPDRAWSAVDTQIGRCLGLRGDRDGS